MSYEVLFDQSYERVLKRKIDGRDFFEAFYARFLDSSEEVKAKFVHTDMALQRKMLKKSFYSLLVFYASNAEDDYLTKIVETHNRRGVTIPNHLYDLWLDGLLETVKEYDPLVNAEVELAWRLVLCVGITYMKFKQSKE